MKKKTIIWLIIIIAIIVGGYFYFSSKKPVTEYTTAEVNRGDIIQTVSVTGELVSENQVDLSFKASGRITQLLADTGDKVSKGQRLAQIDEGTLKLELKQAEADVRFQEETLENMKDNRKTFEKNQRDAQRAKIEASKAAVEAVREQIGERTMLSPIDGMIIRRNFIAGENAAANAAIFTVAEEKNLIIESNVPESDIVKIAAGQKAVVTFDALPADQIFEAAVTFIDPASTVIQDVVSYRIKLSLVSPDERLKPGMSANIDVKTAEKNDVLAAPLRAVKTENSQKFVDVLIDAENGITERKNITTGLEGDEGMVEVASRLNGGEKVVTFVKTQ